MLQNMIERLQLDQIILQNKLSDIMTAPLRELINAQLKECVNMEAEASNIAASRCWTDHDLPLSAKLLACTAAKFRHFNHQNDSAIASALIQHHTKNMIQALTDQHRITIPDKRILSCSQQYLDCQAAIIHQMQRFL